MKVKRGTTVVLTGASRGIGVAIAQALAERGARIALAARSQEELEIIARKVIALGGEAVVIPTDITQADAQEQLVLQASRELGSIDLFINNAGTVIPAAFEELPLEDIERVLAVNLLAPMTLTRRVLPLMLEQGRGHIVNVASLGGLIGIGWGETYSASKHGLVGFTRSLRTSLEVQRRGVSASVVCPGFVEDVGMYADDAVTRGIAAPLFLGTSSARSVARAVLRAVEHDLVEVVVSPRPIRLLLMLAALSPRLGEWLVRMAGGHRVFEGITRAQKHESG